MPAEEPPSALNIADKMAEDRDRLHLQMMSAVSHDLKTPLATIIGSLEIHDRMKDNLTPEKKEILLQTALEEAYRLDGFITNILDMARLDNGMVRAHKRPCDIDQVIHECIRKIGGPGDRAEIVVTPPGFSTSCDTDAALFSRAVQCLLDNAMKHSGNAKPKIGIDFAIGAIDGKRALNVHIRDDGNGIAGEDRETVFSKYTRLAKKDYKNAGTGLGLTIARAILHLLGGVIYLEENRGAGMYGGAFFVIQLPFDAV